MEVIRFSKNKELFNKNLSTGIEFSSNLEPKILKAIAKNTAVDTLLLNGPLIIGNGEVMATGNKKTFQFKGAKELAIQGGAKAFLRIGIFEKVSELLKDLIEEDRLSVNIADESDDKIFVLFSAGYEVEAGAEGKWILNSGSIKGSLSGSLAKRMAVIKGIDPNTGLKDAIRETMSELKLPGHISSPKDIAPNTYLVTESAGSIRGGFAAQLGYDFNWLFESDLEGLQGTVGLHAKLAAQLSVGFDDSGTYALALSRGANDAYVRYQLFKQRKNGRSFALSLASSVKGDLKDFKDTSLDDVLKATLGVHHNQVVESFNTIREWTDAEKLEEKVNGLTEDLLKKLVDAVDDTVEKAREKLITILDAWDNLEDEASSTLWKLLDDKVLGSEDFKLSELSREFEDIANKDKKEVQEFLKEKLQKVGYEKTAFGKLLTAILPTDDILESITESTLFNKVQKKAGNLAGILDLDDQIEHFHKEISAELHLDKIKKAVKTKKIEDLGPLLSAKLSELITENGQFVLDKLKEINSFIETFRKKAKIIFEKTKKALQREYGISFALGFQKQKENSALIDASFKLGATAIKEVFKEAVNGNYGRLLVEDHGEAILLQQATLSHSISKSKTISLSLPFMKRDFAKMNKAMTSANFIQEEDGRLVMYELEAEDTIRRSKKLSQLALEGFYKGKIKGENKILTEKSLKLSYSFKLAKQRFRTKHLEQVIEPFFRIYLPKVFDIDSNTPKISSDQWIRDMDDEIDAIEGNGKNNFGTTMLSLELRVPSEIGAAWFSAPDRAEDYDGVSLAIQRRLRQVLPLYFFENEEVFEKTNLRDELYAILAYEALPAQDDFIVRNGRFKRHWKWNTKKGLLEALRDTETILNLARGLGRVKARLFFDPDPKLKKLAEDFDTLTSAQVSDILNRAATPESPENEHLKRLFSIEQKIIESTIKAGVLLAGFVEKTDKSPNAALKGLQEFGSLITDAFNRRSKFSIIAARGDYTRYLSTELFIAVAQELDPSLQADTQGFFELLVLSKDSEFDFRTYLNGEIPPAEDLIISSKIFDFS